MVNDDSVSIFSSMVSTHREKRKKEVASMLRTMLPKASRQELTPILQNEGWSNLDIIEILEGRDSEDAS